MKQRKAEKVDSNQPKSEDKNETKKQPRPKTNSNSKPWIIAVIAVIVLGLVVVHQVMQQSQFLGSPLGELHTVGFFGQNIHLYCTNPKKLKTKTVVVLHHGLGGSSLDWYDLQQNLAQDGVASCSYDRPGYGYSPAPVTESSPTYDRYIEPLNQLLASKIKSPVVHIGHSLGGAIALSYVLKYPAENNAVLLLDPIGIAPDRAPETNSMLSYASVLSKFGILRLLSFIKSIGGNSPQFSHKTVYENLALQDQTIATAAEEAKLLPSLSTSLKNQITSQTNNGALSIGWVSSSLPDYTLLGMTEATWKPYIQATKQTKLDLQKMLLKKGKKIADYELKAVSHQQLPFSKEMVETVHDFIQESQN